MADTVTPGGSPAAGTSDPPSAPTLLDGSAAQFMAAINGSKAFIPGFVPRHPENERFVRKYRRFNRDVITTAIAAVEANPELEAAKKFNLDRARAAVQYGTAYKPAIDLAKNLWEDMQFTHDYVTALAIQDSLQIYANAKAFGRDPASAQVAAHANNMKRDLQRPGTSSKKKAAKETPSTPAPDTAPQPKQ